jgi:hypothetical protein
MVPTKCMFAICTPTCSVIYDFMILLHLQMVAINLRNNIIAEAATQIQNSRKKPKAYCR